MTSTADNAAALWLLLPTLVAAALAFPELTVQLQLSVEPELEALLGTLFPRLRTQKNGRRKFKDQPAFQEDIKDQPADQEEIKDQIAEQAEITDQDQELAQIDVPMLFGSSELKFGIEMQMDPPPDNREIFASADQVTVDEPLPKVSAQYDYYGGGRTQQPYGGGPYGSGNPYGGGGGDTVNFDFQCKCQAKSALARTLSTPISDPAQASQQQIQQLQEQVRKLQEQINRAQQGKSSFEQFAQMLSLADGLDCNCSGSSTPWNGWPSGVFGGGSGFGGFPRGGGGPLSGAGGGQYPGGGGHFPGGFPGGGMPRGMPPPPMGGGFGGSPFGGGGHPPMFGPMGAAAARQA